MIDSGASHNFVTKALIDEVGVQCVTGTPLRVTLADSSVVRTALVATLAPHIFDD